MWYVKPLRNAIKGQECAPLVNMYIRMYLYSQVERLVKIIAAIKDGQNHFVYAHTHMHTRTGLPIVK